MVDEYLASTDPEQELSLADPRKLRACFGILKVKHGMAHSATHVAKSWLAGAAFRSGAVTQICDFFKQRVWQ